MRDRSIVIAIALSLALTVVAQHRAHAAPAIRYEVTASPDGGELGVEAEISPGLEDSFAVDPAAVGFLDDLRRSVGGKWIPVADDSGAPRVVGCRRTGCRLKYLFHLAGAAAAIDDPDTAAIRGDSLVAPVSTWLLRPAHLPAAGLAGQVHVVATRPLADLGDRGTDWQAAHEMVHLAVPEMSRAQIWLTEGLATYIEPLARCMTGELNSESVWRDLLVGLPKGLPGPGDRGLNRAVSISRRCGDSSVSHSPGVACSWTLGRRWPRFGGG